MCVVVPHILRNSTAHRVCSRSIGGQQLKVIDDFSMVAALMIRTDINVTGEIKRRIMVANRCFHELQRRLRNKILTIKTVFSNYKTQIRPTNCMGRTICMVNDQER